MTITSARSALQVPYLAVRMPLGLLDEQVVVRVFGADSSPHRLLAAKLRRLDTLAASAFGHPAGRPAEASDDAPTTADDAAPTDVADAAPVDREQDIPPAEQQEIAELADSFVAEQELAPRAGELAEDDEIRRVQAAIRAKQTVEEEHGQL